MIQKVATSFVRAMGNYANGVATPVNALAIIAEFVSSLNTVVQEETKRCRIAAQRDVLIHAIESEKTVLLAYFTQRFAERKHALEQFYQLLEQGVAAKDLKSIDVALAGILGILQDNPLQDLAAFAKHWRREDFIIEL
ncbi:MAG: hypothetical protein ACK44M_04580 [Chloroflexus sp.]|uniref:hypothetical protein n=1 Tax=uncultured Chloroflexus sp. TaxID=214040 RepID=UPI00262029DD|nr:hypothetical protein [uncultured Chloroflexus sp.]